MCVLCLREKRVSEWCAKVNMTQSLSTAQKAGGNGEADELVWATVIVI